LNDLTKLDTEDLWAYVLMFPQFGFLLENTTNDKIKLKGLNQKG